MPEGKDQEVPESHPESAIPATYPAARLGSRPGKGGRGRTVASRSPRTQNPISEWQKTVELHLVADFIVASELMYFSCTATSGDI